MKKKIKKIIEYLKLRHRARQADYYARLMNGMSYRLLPPSFYILNDAETVRREVNRIQCEMVEKFERYSKEEAVAFRESRAYRMKKNAEMRRIEAERKAQEENGSEKAETLR